MYLFRTYRTAYSEVPLELLLKDTYRAAYSEVPLELPTYNKLTFTFYCQGNPQMRHFILVLDPFLIISHFITKMIYRLHSIALSI